MRHLYTRRIEAVESLPPLPRTLFLLHNFYGVDVGTIADILGEDQDIIAACLADARTIVRAHVCYTEPVPNVGPSTAALQVQLQQDYRRWLETAFAEAGYPGTVDWPIPDDITADEAAAATFIVALLPAFMQRTVARSRRGDVATVDLWSTVWLFRRCRRRLLLRVTEALRCAGWEPFDIWLAERLMPGRRYPHGYAEHRRRRRLLPEERPLTEVETNRAEIADSVQIPERLADQPERMRQVWILFHLYGRPYEEIARRLGISGGCARRLREQAEYAIGGWPYPSLVQHIRFDLMVMRLGLEIRWRIFRSVFYG